MMMAFKYDEKKSKSSTIGVLEHNIEWRVQQQQLKHILTQFLTSEEIHKTLMKCFR